MFTVLQNWFAKNPENVKKGQKTIFAGDNFDCIFLNKECKREILSLPVFHTIFFFTGLTTKVNSVLCYHSEGCATASVLKFKCTSRLHISLPESPSPFSWKLDGPQSGPNNFQPFFFIFVWSIFQIPECPPPHPPPGRW